MSDGNGRHIQSYTLCTTLPPSDGWMNCRVATLLNIDEDSTHYLITTNLHGIEADSLRVQLQGEHLIIEGYAQHEIRHSLNKRVRYIRNVQLPEPVDSRYLEAQYWADGTLIVHVPKRLN